MCFFFIRAIPYCNFICECVLYTSYQLIRCHCYEIKDLQEFMDDASQGVIYVSLGSLIQPNDVDAIGTIFIRALQRLPQKVIFKWNPEILPSKPSNFLVRSWVPQTSILS